MKRFHLVIANHKRISHFIDNFSRIIGFTPARDAIYIFDSSPEITSQTELRIADHLCSYGLEWNSNLFFIRRRNWGYNLGANLDYFRCLNEGLIESPQYCFFMQDHYLDLQKNSKEDVFPEGITLDLDNVSSQFEQDESLGCLFYSRYGIRVVTSNPIHTYDGTFFGDGDDLIPGAKRRSLLVDGANFVTRPGLYLNWIKKHPEYLTKGDGSYGFVIVWEDRIGRILYDQGVTWFDMGRNTRFRNIEELDHIEKELGKKISRLWYDHRIWYVFYGKDLQLYWPFPFISFLKYLGTFMANQISFPRDKSLIFMNN